ncbi:hypothetical protein ACQPZX_23960 [Actinoplanes sp. CA-142083]|uniref:hypothetical protein n=1 Tax=Actinoplanes sp. CA-142083 TaxID=3239903 RepID=UPI003D90411A
MSRRRLLPVLVLVVVLSGCGDGDDLATMSQTDVKQQVERYAGQTLTASGAAAFVDSAANVTGCPRDNGRSLADPDEAFYVQGLYSLPVPADQVTATIGKVRDQWQRNGYSISSTATPTELSATATDAYRLDLTANPPIGLRLSIASPCYRPS